MAPTFERKTRKFFIIIAKEGDSFANFHENYFKCPMQKETDFYIFDLFTFNEESSILSLNKYYPIGDEGIYSVYFAFCSEI